ncbi:MAG: hemolysin family protein [Sphaerochaetaceae bacterium]
MSLHLIVIILLLVLSAFFSASETAFTSLSFLQIKMLESEGKRGGKLAATLAKNSDTLLTGILIGNNIVNLSASALTTTFTIRLWGSGAIGIATGVLTFIILVFGEITPKHLAINHNTTLVRFVAYPIRGFLTLIYPLIRVILYLSSRITHLFSKERSNTISFEGLMHVVDVAEDEGIVDEHETSLVQRVLHFREAPVKSVMTHRTEVFSLSDTLTLKEAFPSIVASGYSRIPVYHESGENIVGILLLRDLLEAKVKGETEQTLDLLLHPPIFVSETRKLDAMFTLFQQEKLQIAVVLDEYGGLSGVVTMEDVVEQLFGEIYDEHESGDYHRIRAEGDGSFIIKADTTMQQVKDELDLVIESQELSRTLAAYLIEELGSIPTIGETLSLSFGTFSIVSMKGKRVESVRLTLSPVEKEELH